MSPEAGTDETTDEEEAPEPDALREGVRERLAEALGDDVVDTHLVPGRELWVRVATPAWRRVAEVARDRLGCRYFCFLSAIDWLPSPYGKGEDDPTEEAKPIDTEIVQGYAGGETRFQLLARLYNVAEHWGVMLKTDVPDDLTVDSWVPVYAGASWHERETWEMFGIDFAGHVDMRHIYLPGDFEGHPLRKDFPLVARMVKPWPGIVDVEPMPDEGDASAAESGDDASAAESGDDASAAESGDDA